MASAADLPLLVLPVWGDGEPAVEHGPAILWAMRRVPAEVIDKVAFSNWAATYRLRTRSTQVYLKLLPPVQRAQVDRIRVLAELFPEVVPQVLAVEPESGWLLMADHGGEDVCAAGDAAATTAVAYARLQAAAAGRDDLLAACTPVDLSRCVDELLAFLGSAGPHDDATGPSVTAAHYIGRRDAERYLALIGSRTQVLQRHVAAATWLPPTVCHGDLHLGNVALRPDGGVVIFDWDELCTGPVGLSLQGLLGGCTRATLVLSRMATGRDPGDGPEARVLSAYLRTLVAAGHASERTLLAGLPGALCAGQLRFIASFGKYPGAQDVGAPGQTLRHRLSDLLDLCDWLSSRDEDTALAQADDYLARGEPARAHRLVQDRLARAPERVDLLVRFGQGALALGDSEQAREAFAMAWDRAPDRLEACRGLAHALLEQSSFAAAQSVLDQARQARGGLPGELDELRARIEQWQRLQHEANEPGAMPCIALTDDERDRGQLGPGVRALVAELFRRHGALQLDNVFSPATVAAMQTEFSRQQAGCLARPERSGVLKVGDRRYMLTMALEGIFGDARVVASDLLLPLMRALLGPECILSAYTAVVSQPGSADQEPHKDHTPLFEESGWKLEMPSFAAQVIVPLEPLDHVTGTTRIVPCSQRRPLREAMANLPANDPQVPLGSCLLLDYSVAHHGLGNRSARMRPIVNLIYSRPWFRDCRNYHLQPPLRFSDGFYDHAPESVRSLIGWWQAERMAALRSRA